MHTFQENMVEQLEWCGEAPFYALGPFTTCDADIFFIPADKEPAAGIPALYAHLQAQGWEVAHEHLLVRGFPVQFLAASGLTEEAVREAERMDYEGVAATAALRSRIRPMRGATSSAGAASSRRS